jgi:Ca-activated chloride channel family protein
MSLDEMLNQLCNVSALRSRTRLVLALALLAVAVMCSPWAAEGTGSVAGGSDGQQVFRGTTRVVPVVVTVHDRSGRLVTDLSAEEFEVIDDGRPAQIQIFSVAKVPLRVAILLDTSGSVTGLVGVSRQGARRLRDELLAFVDALVPPDTASFGTFGAEIAIGQVFTADRTYFERVFDQDVWAGGGSPLWEALLRAIDSVRMAEHRRVVIAYTDGIDTGGATGSTATEAAVLSAAVREDCMLYFVRPGNKAPSATVGLPLAVAALATSTGGGTFESTTQVEPQSAFAAISAELRQQYLLGFSPATVDGRVHNLQVRVRRPGVVVRARQTFLAAKTP